MDEATLMALLNYLIGGAPLDGEISTDDNRALTFAGNLNDYLADPITGAVTGGLDYAAFEPTVEREEVELAGRRMLTDWMNRRPGTVKQIIAEEIASGGDQASAFAIISNIVNGEPTTPEEAELKAQLSASLPPIMTYDELTGQMQQGGIDMEAVWDMAGELDSAISSDPIVDEYSEDGLRGYNVSEMPSELAQKFQDLGLPLPTEQYSVESVMGPEWQAERDILMPQQLGAMQQASADQAAAREAMARFALERGSTYEDAGFRPQSIPADRDAMVSMDLAGMQPSNRMTPEVEDRVMSWDLAGMEPSARSEGGQGGGMSLGFGMVDPRRVLNEAESAAEDFDLTGAYQTGTLMNLLAPGTGIIGGALAGLTGQGVTDGGRGGGGDREEASATGITPSRSSAGRHNARTKRVREREAVDTSPWMDAYMSFADQSRKTFGAPQQQGIGEAHSAILQGRTPLTDALSARGYHTQGNQAAMNSYFEDLKRRGVIR